MQCGDFLNGAIRGCMDAYEHEAEITLIGSELRNKWLPLEVVIHCILKCETRVYCRDAFGVEVVCVLLLGVPIVHLLPRPFAQDVIVAMPSLVDFLKTARLDRVGAFTYSHEESTSAFSLPDDVAPELKRERLERLMTLQSEISLSLQAPLVGSRRRVLVDGRDNGPKGRLRGRTARQAPEIDGCVWLRGGTAAIGSFVNAEIESADPHDLHGKIVEAEETESLARMV